MAAPIFQRTVVDTQGNVVAGAVVEVRNEATDELAPIFVDRPLTDVKANPFTTDSTGFIRFFAAAGEYRIKATFGEEEIIFRFVQLLDKDELIDFDSSQTLLNKTISFGSNTLTDVASINTTQTLTNKTLTSPALTDPSYTGTLTGGTGVVNLGSGQLFKDASGNVGIGTTTSLKTLTTLGGVALLGSNNNIGNELFFYRQGASLHGYIGWETPSNPNSAWTFDSSNGNPIRWATDSIERMRIDSAGNVGIGTSSPTAALDIVRPDGGASPLLRSHSGGRTMLMGIIPAFGGGVVSVTTAHPLMFETNSVERMRITSAGDLQFNSGYGSVATVFGCRAWVNFNGTGTVAIRASGNVSSITDNGVGIYTVNFTTAMPDANYACNVTGRAGSALFGGVDSGIPPLASAVQVGTLLGTTFTDSVYVAVTVFR